ncbi:MAG: hypothetical protein ABFD91_00680 [Anaerohalosphaeraceae bacterium]
MLIRLEAAANRMLIQQKSTGENVILPDKGQVLLNPYDRFKVLVVAKK